MVNAIHVDTFLNILGKTAGKKLSTAVQVSIAKVFELINAINISILFLIFLGKTAGKKLTANDVKSVLVTLQENAYKTGLTQDQIVQLVEVASSKKYSEFNLLKNCVKFRSSTTSR